MKILLLQDVEHVGPRGELVTVADGFARNFLIPRKLAQVATKGGEKFSKQLKAMEGKRQAKLEAEFRALAEKLLGVSCTIVRKAHEDQKLFGSVSSQDISASLAAQGFAIDRKKIHLAEPIKALGVYTVPVKLAPGIESPVKVWVVKEGEQK